MRTGLKVGGAIVMAAIGAVSQALNILNFKPDFPWPLITLISILLFIFIVFWGWYGAESRVRRLEKARPHVVFDGLSPATTLITPTMRKGYFVRLDFLNNTADPSGEASTLHDLTASIEVFDGDGKSIDAWDGRWANKDAPKTSGDIWLLNRVELPANNQRATLDIGFRFEGEQILTGWDNAHYFGVTPARVPIKPGLYRLRVTLAASNFKITDFWFSFAIPSEPQSDTCWPKVTLI